MKIRKIIECALPVLVCAVAARWVSEFLADVWLANFCFGAIAGFTACYIVKVIK